MSSVQGKPHRFSALHERSMASLNPLFRQRVQQVLDSLARLGWQPIVFSGRRSEKEQEKLKKAGTGATRSWHVESHHRDVFQSGVTFTIHGEAADIVDRRYLWAGPAANLNFRFWHDLGIQAELAHLEWGGKWTGGQHPRDVAHVQLKEIRVTQDMRGVRA